VNIRKHRGFSAKSPGPAGFDQVDQGWLDLDPLDLDLTVADTCGLSDAAGFDQACRIWIRRHRTHACGCAAEGGCYTRFSKETKSKPICMPVSIFMHIVDISE
jgi:hypothetical protein